MNPVMLNDVTVNLDAAHDLIHAGYGSLGTEGFVRAFRAAAEAICDGHAAVTVCEVSARYGASTGCTSGGADGGWAEDFGLWQAIHDCVDFVDGQWVVLPQAVDIAHSRLCVWRSRNDAAYQRAYGVD